MKLLPDNYLKDIYDCVCWSCGEFVPDNLLEELLEGYKTTEDLAQKLALESLLIGIIWKGVDPEDIVDIPELLQQVIDWKDLQSGKRTLQ